MALKWSNENYNYNTEYARSKIRPNGGWWYTSEIVSYLTSYNTSSIYMDGENNMDLYKGLLD